jgi:hypothetical protein
MWYGEKLEQHLVARAGDFLYVPANMPHLPYNLSGSESRVAIIASTDPDDEESIVLLLELDRERGTATSARQKEQETFTTAVTERRIPGGPTEDSDVPTRHGPSVVLSGLFAAQT